MAKRESTFINMLVTMLVINLVAAFALAGVYNLTKEPIARSQQARKITALNHVLPDFDSVSSLSITIPEMELPIVFYYAMLNTDTVGIAVETHTMSGFSGLIRAMVGFKPDGTIIDVVHLEHRETPGLGDKIEKGKSDWSNLFIGKHPETFDLKVRQDGGDVDAITAATITARAYCEAIQLAYDALIKHGGGIRHE